MSDTASAPERWQRWLLPSWAVFATVNAVLMYRLSGAETIPFHFVWVSTAVFYGLRPFSLRLTWLTCGVVTVVTGVPLLLHAAAGTIGWEETSEIPLMALLFLVMVWHVRRRMAATAEACRMAAAERLGRQTQRRFVRLASHELRTPITVARGFTELIRESADSAEAVEDLDVVLEELDKLEGTVARLLRLARAEDAPLDLVEVDLAELLCQTARRWAPTAPSRRFEVDCEEMWVRIDQARLAVATDSMLENAVRHTGDGGVIRLWATHDGADVVFAVQDDGTGIDEADLPLVFEGFHSTGPHSGTGLGLAIVRSVATAHGGTVSARNATDGGAIIRLVLPAAYRARSAVEGQREGQHGGGPGESELAAR
jgi:two-component system, OmpR family, sensor kinase